MEKEKSFLDAWKLVMNILVEEGTIKKEEIDNGFQIPYEWLFSSLVNRDTIIRAMRNIHEKNFQASYPLKNFKKYLDITYIEENDAPVLKISAGNRCIMITDAKIQSRKKLQKIVSPDEFISEITNAKKTEKLFEMENMGISREIAEKAVEIFFDKKQEKIEEIAAPNILTDMALNFRRYYEYLCKEESIAKASREREESFGGIIEPATDERDGRIPEPIPGEPRERVSDIYSFEQRDGILKGLKPERLIKFDSIDERGNIVRGAYTCYIYPQPQNNDGYLIISEPLEGNKFTRAVFVTKDEVDEFRGEEQDLNEFWQEFVRIYIEEMTGSEFRAENSTYVFNHSTDLDTYRQKLEAVINGIDKSNPKHIVARRASEKLYGKVTMSAGLSDVTRKGLDEARNAVNGDKQKDDQTKDDDGEGEK